MMVIIARLREWARLCVFVRGGGTRARARACVCVCVCVCVEKKTTTRNVKKFWSSGSDIVCFNLVQRPFVHVKRSQCFGSTLRYIFSARMTRSNDVSENRMAVLVFCSCIVIKSSWALYPVTWVIILFWLNCKWTSASVCVCVFCALACLFVWVGGSACVCVFVCAELPS